MHQYQIDMIAEALEDNNIQATPEQIEAIAKSVMYSVEMEREMQSYQFVGHKEECSECKSLKIRLAEVQKERDIYHNNVCIRRGTQDVYIDGDTVMYRK